MNNTTYMLSGTHLSCVRQDTLLFSDMSFQLEPSQLLLIEGDNGSGKSSLLRLIAGLATPRSGNIFWNNQPIREAGVNYTKQLHYLGHENGLKMGLTVYENMQLANQLQEEPLIQAEEILQMLQLQAKATLLAKQLSAGQKRKLALSKLWLVKKPLWILDEPMTALDQAASSLFLTHLQMHLMTGGMCVMTSHHALQIHFPEMTVLRLKAC